MGRSEGIALMVALMAMLLLSALGAALILTTSSETLISANFRLAAEGLYAADAAAERALDELLTIADWDVLLDGSTRSAFVDGPPRGTRVLSDGTAIDLAAIVNVANCQKVTACADRDMDAYTQERPWGPNNPRWQLYAYGGLADMLAADAIRSSFYVIVMVADDPSENDGDPLHDGLAADNPGRGVLSLRAEAFGPRGAHKTLEATVAHVNSSQAERGYTGQRGGDTDNSHAREAPVRATRDAVSMQTFSLGGP